MSCPLHQQVGGARLGDPIGTVIVDSGTSFMYLPPSAYAAVRDHWRSHCPWGDCRARDAAGQYPDDYCYRMDQPTLARFDELSLHFGGGVTLPFGPLDYAYELYQGVWCLGIFDNERRGGWLKMPSTPFHGPAPPARLVPPTAQAAPAHPGAPPEQLGRSAWPSQPASPCSQDVDCATTSANRSGGVLGACNMRHHEVIFDREHRRWF